MKKQPTRARSSSTQSLPVRHQFDHAVPTVIHRPEEKMTALGRLTHHVLQDPRKYSTWALTLLLGVLAVIVIWNLSSGGRTQSSAAWSKLEMAKKAEQRVDVAKEYPNSPVSMWALLQAATEFYNTALADLPNNRDVALPLFKKAIDLFDQVAAEAPKDSFQARAAVLGKARSLEARNELSKAIEQYELVAKNWPGTPEAAQAKQLAESLQKPEAAAFYKELYAYSPSKVQLPPLSTEELKLPQPGHRVAEKPDFPARETDALGRDAAGAGASHRRREEQSRTTPGRDGCQAERAHGQERIVKAPDNQDKASVRCPISRSRRPRKKPPANPTLDPCGRRLCRKHPWNSRSSLEPKASGSTPTSPAASPTILGASSRRSSTPRPCW